MVFVDFLNPGCYTQLYMIESKSKAFKCGLYEGFYWSLFISFIIILASIRLILTHKKYELDTYDVKKYTLVIISIIFIFLITFFSVGYINNWNNYQELISKYKKQGLKDNEILYILGLESGNSSTIGSTIAATSAIFLAPKKEIKNEGENNKK